MTRRGGFRRLGAFLAAVVVGVALGTPPAGADPAGPTDYRSEVIAIEPPVAGLTARMIGGDAFLELTVEPGLTVVVTGYQGEPYLRFLADGTVQENRRSPTAFLNDDRFGEGDVDPDADADASPDWRAVASSGRYAWHDHRTHWMGRDRPLGAEPGDRVVEGVVPLLVDDEPVAVTVASTLQPGPAVAPVLVGLLAGAGIVGAASLLGGIRRGPAVATLVVAIPALWVGWRQVASMPPETAPSVLNWLLPAVAIAAALAALVLGTGPATGGIRGHPVVAIGSSAVAAGELALWGWLRRGGLARAILPTDAPYWLDRAVTATALTAGLGALLVVVAGSVRQATRPTTRPAPA